MSDLRLGVQPGEEIDRETSFTFRFNGREVPALAGDTIASALLASGSGCCRAATSTTGRAAC